MHRLFSALGSALVMGGVAILIYLGVTYAQSSAPAAPHWNKAQQNAAEKLQKRLSGHQTVAVPKGLNGQAVRPGGEPAVRMVIPKIGVDSRVVETPPTGGIWTVADWAVGHLTTSPEPGAPGNGAYAAHDDIKGEIFKRLAELGPGDAITVYTAHAVYHYIVVDQQTVDPSDVAVLAPTRQPTVTLVSCAPYWVDTQRIIVKAALKSFSAA